MYRLLRLLQLSASVTGTAYTLVIHDDSLITKVIADWVGHMQEYGAALKVVKIEADGNPDLVEKYKVSMK